MDAWQYSALNVRFKALQNQLLGTIAHTSSNSNSVSVGAVDVEMTTEQCVETSKGAIKRKAEDYNPSDTPRRNRFLMMLDTYTQTEASFLTDSRKDSVHVANAVMENQRRLDHIESILENLEEKLDILLGEQLDHSRVRTSTSGTDIKSPTASHSDLPEPSHTPVLENPMFPEAGAHSQSAINTMRSYVTSVSPTVNYCAPRASNSEPYAQGDFPQSSSQTFDTVPKNSVSNEKSEALPRGRDLNVLDASPHLLVPVIIAVSGKNKRNITAEVPLQDLLNGNQISVEGVNNICLSRGSWLGDRMNEDGRVWYCGDSKIIHRAEASGSNPAKLSLNLLEALFTRDEMAASNVNGARGRDLLDPLKIKAIQVHVNFKFPIEPEKQELRWMVLKPRIDSKCRAQRRLQRDQQARLDGSQGPYRTSRNSRAPIINQRVREELLYGYVKSEPCRRVAQDGQLVVESFQGATGTDDDRMGHVAGFDQSQPTMAVLPVHRNDSVTAGEPKMS